MFDYFAEVSVATTPSPTTTPLETFSATAEVDASIATSTLAADDAVSSVSRRPPTIVFLLFYISIL